MATISEKIPKRGFCNVEQNQVTIFIEYISFPFDGSTKRNMTFIKNSNQCWYLSKGKCNMGKECPIYKEAEEEIKLDISDKRL